jgi:hypothetical protein
VRVYRMVGLEGKSTAVRKALEGGHGGGDSALFGGINREEE